MTGPLETILLVDDEDTVLRVSSRVLAKHGFGVLTAHSAEDALLAAEGQSVHLLLTDVMMPGLNGWQLAEALLARRPSVRVLFMSG